MSVKLVDVTQRYPSQAKPLYDKFSAEFERGKVHAVLGVSGSGKTTLLNMIAGITEYSGRIECDTVSYVFQDSRLINNITVADNLRLVLRGVSENKCELNGKTDKILTLAELERYADKYPDELSGGERQRLSIARAFAYPSKVILMDEPFNSLDYGVKDRLFKQFTKMLIAEPKTVLFVTHDVDEALSLADETYLLQGVSVKLTHIASLREDKREREIYSDEYLKLRKQITDNLKLLKNR